MPNIVIRAPRAGDGEGLAEVWLDAAAYYASLNPELFQVPSREGLAEWCEGWAEKPAAEESLLLVAEEDGMVAGFIAADIVPPMEEAARQFVKDVGLTRLTINALVVRQSSWRKGIGGQLMSRAEQWGRGRGASVVVLDTYVESPVSVRFYETRLGYERRALVFREQL